MVGLWYFQNDQKIFISISNSYGLNIFEDCGGTVVGVLILEGIKPIIPLDNGLYNHGKMFLILFFLLSNIKKYAIFTKEN